MNLYECAGKKHFVSLKLEGQSEALTRDLPLSKQAALATAPGPPPYSYVVVKLDQRLELWSSIKSSLGISCLLKHKVDPMSV